MVVNDETPSPDSSSKKHSRRLRIIGVIVLLLGLGGAGLVYWLGTRSANAADNELLMQYNESTTRAERRQVELLFGKMGGFFDKVSDSLKQPGTQACLIAVVSILVARGFFFAARPPRRDDETH